MTAQTIVQAEALDWLAQHAAPAHSSVVTSLPDVSELPDHDFAGWRDWFVAAAARVLRWLPANGVAIFYQSDIRHEGVWVDKSYLLQRAAELEGARLLWHKIVCRKPAGTVALGRPSYSHMLCFAARSAFGQAASSTGDKRARAAPKPGPDVLPDAGEMSWSRAMGETACQVACGYLRDQTNTRVVVDPFCGRGSVLGVASSFGFDVIGVDLCAKRCRAARACVRAAISLRSNCQIAGA